jgi:2-polyprenyl-3-methyl-5-hydroxy-6-metoxy-1,4-benzoquinol methylase
MTQEYHEKDFGTVGYEEFYSDHYFQAFDDATALNINEVLPRGQWALDVANEIKAKDVLDLGCLEGFIVLTLVNNCPSVKSGVGVDLSKKGISLGTQRAIKFDLPIDFYQMTLEAYLEGCVKKGQHFDLITLFEVMEHVESPEYVLQLVDKVKTPKGTVLISTPDFEAPTYGKDDEQNKCHVRLYTTADEDYEAENVYGHTRTATSLSKQIGKDRIQDMEVINELINCRYV